jgi:hypothetical protein
MDPYGQCFFDERVLKNTSSDSKKVEFVFFVVESLSNPGKSVSTTKLSGDIGLKIFPDFEAPLKNLRK